MSCHVKTCLITPPMPGFDRWWVRIYGVQDELPVFGMAEEADFTTCFNDALFEAFGAMPEFDPP